MEEEPIAIPNAPWWLPHSHVLLKEDYTAADESWVLARTAKMSVQAGSTKATGEVQMGKDRGVLQIERMTIPGSVVAVQRRNGRVKTVHLPQEAEKLLVTDLAYIIGQIEALNEVMTPEEQADFLPGAPAPSEEPLRMVK